MTKINTYNFINKSININKSKKILIQIHRLITKLKHIHTRKHIKIRKKYFYFLKRLHME